MRLIKMFGLAAVAAVAAMAFVGASSATAMTSALCTAHELPCAAANVYTGHVEGLAINPELLTNLGNITCEHSVILGNALGLVTDGPVVGHLELVDFTGNCKLGPEPCTVTTITLGLLLLLMEADDEGSLESHTTEVLVKCGKITHCVYGGLPKLTALGSSKMANGKGLIHANEAELGRISGLLCPATSKWDALYEIILPAPLYISS